MKIQGEFSFNRIDRIILFIISSFISASFFLWILRNAIRVQSPVILALTIGIALLVARFGVRQFRFPVIRMGKKDFGPYIVLAVCLILSALFLLEPIFSHPYSAFGIPNKDTQDGITAFIALHGYPPQSYKTAENRFIPGSVSDTFLAYPNALHSSAALLNIFGVFPFHSTWIVVCIGLLVTSLSIFLLVKTISNNPYYAGLVAGFFAVSTIRIPLTAIISVVMLYSYTLIVPALLLSLVSVFNNKTAFSFTLPSIGIALFVASYYYGVTIVFAAMLVGFALLLLLVWDSVRMRLLVRIILWSIPFIVFVMYFQDRAYWQYAIHTAIHFDPYDPSLKIPPADTPLYMMFYSISMIGAGYALRKKKWNTDMGALLTFYLFLINVGFLLLIPLTVVGGGLIGGILREEAARLALLQPFFFIFFLVGFSQWFKNKYVQMFVAAAGISLSLFFRVDIPPYRVIPSDMQSSFYNRADRDKGITLLSDMRLFVDDRTWSKNLIEAFAYLKTQDIQDDSVLVWHDIDPFLSERAVAGWGSVYLTRKLLRRTDLNTLTETIDGDLLHYYMREHIGYLLILYPTDNNVRELEKNVGVQRIWNHGGIYIYHFIFT
jgi:hypothetical protein